MCPMPQDESDLDYRESECGPDEVLVQRTPCGLYTRSTTAGITRLMNRL